MYTICECEILQLTTNFLAIVIFLHVLQSPSENAPKRRCFSVEWMMLINFDLKVFLKIEEYLDERKKKPAS